MFAKQISTASPASHKIHKFKERLNAATRFTGGKKTDIGRFDRDRGQGSKEKRCYRHKTLSRGKENLAQVVRKVLRDPTKETALMTRDRPSSETKAVAKVVVVQSTSGTRCWYRTFTCKRCRGKGIIALGYENS